MKMDQVKMLPHIFLLITILFNEVISYRNDKITSTIAELDTSICQGIRQPQKGGAKQFLQDVKMFNSLFRKIKKTCLSTKEQELHGKKGVLAEIVLKSHPHFLTLQIDEDALRNEGKWEETDLKLLHSLFNETERIKNKLEGSVKKT